MGSELLPADSPRISGLLQGDLKMANTETVVNTTTGIVQYFSNEEIVLAHYNRHGHWFEIKDGLNGRELWHKGQRRLVGIIQVVDARV